MKARTAVYSIRISTSRLSSLEANDVPVPKKIGVLRSYLLKYYQISNISGYTEMVIWRIK